MPLGGVRRGERRLDRAAPALEHYPPRTLEGAPAAGWPLEAAAGRPVDAERLAGWIREAYRAAYGPIPEGSADAETLRPQVNDRRPPWEELREHAIGFVGTSPDDFGGDLLASEDLVDALARHDVLAVDSLSQSSLLEGVRDLDPAWWRTGPVGPL